MQQPEASDQSLKEEESKEEEEEEAQDPAPPPPRGGPTAPAPKRARTNTPWTPAEEQRLKTMRDAGNSWGEIAKVGTTTTGSET